MLKRTLTKGIEIILKISVVNHTFIMKDLECYE